MSGTEACASQSEDSVPHWHVVGFHSAGHEKKLSDHLALCRSVDGGDEVLAVLLQRLLHHLHHLVRPDGRLLLLQHLVQHEIPHHGAHDLRQRSNFEGSLLVCMNQ